MMSLTIRNLIVAHCLYFATSDSFICRISDIQVYDKHACQGACVADDQNKLS